MNKLIMNTIVSMIEIIAMNWVHVSLPQRAKQTDPANDSSRAWLGVRLLWNGKYDLGIFDSFY